MQDNFHLLHNSVRHAPSNLQNTIKALCDMLHKHEAHKFSLDRKSYDLTDHLHYGFYLLQTTTVVKKYELGQMDVDMDTNEDDDQVIEEIDEEDLAVDDF
jgi:hypothetical protein